MMKSILIFISILIFGISNLKADVEIQGFKKNSWNHSWNESIRKALLSENYSALINEDIDSNDLKELGCPNFNSKGSQSSNSNIDEKVDFWIVFFSALVRAESAFNIKATSKTPKGGHGNYGLLQFSKSTARSQCQMNTVDELLSPDLQLACGVKLLNWQLSGAPNSKGKLLRPDLKGQLFGKYILLWGPLRQNDKRGRAILVSWFKDHLSQLPICKA